MTSEYCYTQGYRKLRRQLSEVVREINKGGFIVSTSGGSHVDLLDGYVFKQHPDKSYFSFNTIPFLDGIFDTTFNLPKDRLNAIVYAKGANYMYNQKEDSWLWHPEASMSWILNLLLNGIEQKKRIVPLVDNIQRTVDEYTYDHSHIHKGGRL